MYFDLGTITYSLASIFLLLLVIGQIRICNQGNSSMVLLLATLITFAWSSVLTVRPEIPIKYFYLVACLEVLKNLAWIILLLSVLGIRKAVFARFKDEEDPRNLLVIAGISLGIPGILLLYLLHIRFIDSSILFYPSLGGRTVLAGYLLVAITGLALLEQVI